jgi:hypothetical protein
MYKIIYPTADTVLYSQFPNKNASADEILEITKATVGNPSIVGDDTVYYSNTLNSRIFIKFDLSDISSSIVSGKIDSNTAQYFLTLKATTATDLPIRYTLWAYPISGSWTNGTGHYSNLPEISNGVSWKYRSDKVTGTQWTTSSYNANSTGSYDTVYGGGNWFTNYSASQTFENESPDMRMDVTNVVNAWLAGSIVNQGFVVKLSDANEFDTTVFQSLQFFSNESHTIFLPRLEVYWNDTNLSGTGSFNEIGSDDFVLDTKNLRETYTNAEKPKVRLHIRERFPIQTYATSSNYLNSKRLPTGSYFQIQDVATDEVIVPFNTVGTKVNCDSSGNYIKLDCGSFLPERYYKIVIKSEFDGGDTVRVTDDNHIFRIRRN